MFSRRSKAGTMPVYAEARSAVHSRARSCTLPAMRPSPKLPPSQARRTPAAGARLLSLATSLALVGGCKGAVSFNLGTPSASAEAEGRSETTTTAAPRPAVRIVRAGDRLTYENGEIEFETGSADLKGDTTAEVLDQLAATLKRYPALVVLVEGHTDSRGSRDSNQRLSEARARAIEAALIKRGVGVDRLSTVGLGESAPARPEPDACHNKAEEKVAKERLDDCHEIWAFNRRAAFVVKEGSESLPGEGSAVSPPPAVAVVAAPPVVKKTKAGRPDWALRFFGGYGLSVQPPALHGGHFGVALHASQRFGKQGRGYIGGGPRLHYRGLVHTQSDSVANTTTHLVLHQFGPEGDLLVGGGSQKVVALFSLRVGLGVSSFKARVTDGLMQSSADALRLGGWALGGVVVLGKLGPRWSLGGHAEAGVLGIPNLALAVEIGLNIAWHFGRGRRNGI